VLREADGWYVCITAETKKRAYPKTDKVIGIDLGLKDLAIASDGYVFDNPRTLRKWSNKLSKSQKSLSRKKLGSNNRNKAKKELKSLHQKIARVRGDNLHKVTSQIINENQVIICEDLNTRGMLKNHKLAKSISDASWGKLTSMLEYKSKWADREFVKVSAHYTSQDCNNCGWRKSDLKLSDRIWTCGSCEQSNDRDINAAKNIRDKGIKKLSESGIAIKLQEKEAGHAFSTFGYIGPVRVGAEELIQTNRETLSGTEESHAL